MVDDVDRANDLAEAERAGSIEQQLARSLVQRAAVLTAANGQRLCVDCRQPIDGRRLAAVPHAIACAGCESHAEQAKPHHRRKSWAM